MNRDHIGTRPPPAPGSSAYVEAGLEVVEEWESSDGQRYRLVCRSGLYRLEIWVLYKWEAVANGLQQLARHYRRQRVAELLIEQDMRNVSELKRRSG